MKKIKSLCLSIFAIAAVLLLTGCGNKTAIDANEFQTTMEGKKFAVQDVTYQFSQYDYVKTALLALKDDYSYQIEFYVLDNEENAKSFFESNKSVFEESKTSGAVGTSVELGNHQKYTLSTGGDYKVISRIDNTLVYSDVEESNKDEVEELVDELGY